MKTIYKYELEVIDRQKIDMPDGAEILTVQIQNNKPCLWAKVNTERPNQQRVIQIYGTGNTCDFKDRKYIGTFQLYGGGFVGHVFEYTGL